jgi:hypothetical protein
MVVSALLGVSAVRNEHTNSYLGWRRESSQIPLRNSGFSGISGVAGSGEVRRECVILDSTQDPRQTQKDAVCSKHGAANLRKGLADEKW